MASVIVTGGAGFLGTHLCRALDAAGHSVRVIDLKENPEYHTDIADVRDEAKMLDLIRDCEVVFHLASLIEAGESVTEPKKYTDYNVMGTISVLEAMKHNKVPTFIFSSSAAIYGEPQNIPIHEDDRTLPINPYGMTKLAMEALLSSYCYAHGITGIGLRYFNLYGPEEHHEPETHAIPRFIEQIYTDKEVTVWGEGQHQRDFVYISDIVAAHLDALNFSQVAENLHKYHYFNLSTEQAHSVKEVIEKIAELLNKTPNVTHFPERPGDPLELVATAQKAREQLGWQAEVSLNEGLQNTVQYFLDQWK